MRIVKLLGTVGAAALLAAAVSMPAHSAGEMANTQLKDASGKAVGDVDLMQTPAGVLIKLQIKGPDRRASTPSTSMPSASAKRRFESAGPAFQSGQPQARHPAPARAMPATCRTCTVPQSGELSVEVVNSAISLETGQAELGCSTMTARLWWFHAKADDYKTDPAGNAGDRIACGVIQQSGAATVGSSPPPKQ
jgi:Cu-Zn family superoxide dismutase